MNSEERQLITGLFDRMRGMGAMDKDREAEALINQSVRQIPDSAYMLVQSVLVQENALQQAGSRIEELEQRVREMEDSRPAASGGGSFLGGLFGGGAQPASRSSVPATGRTSPGFGQGRPQQGGPQQGGSPWGQAGMGNQPMGQQPGRAGGGFLASAMTTAAGVAGGMLLANSISSMMGGSNSAQAATPAASTETSQEALGPPEPADQGGHYQDAADNDPGNYDAGGGDFGGGDFDV